MAKQDAGVVFGEMRELQPAGRIADHVDVGIRRAQSGVDDEVAVVELHVGLVEAKTLDVRGASGGDEEVRSGDHGRRSVGHVHGGAHGALATFDA